MSLIITVVALMLAFSFFCSISEAALYSVPAPHVENLRRENTARGKRLALLRGRIDRPITAILFLNTFANTMGAAIAGALVGLYFSDKIMLPFSLVLTIMVLIFAEIVPKSLGVSFSRQLAPMLSLPIQLMVWAFWPLVRFGELITNIIRPSQEDSGPSEDEIMAMAHLGAQGGGILPEEEEWVKNVLRLNDKTAGDLMTPRPVVSTLVASRTVGEVEKELPLLFHSRIPVITEEGPDHVVGIVMRRSLVDAVVKGDKDLLIKDLARKEMRVDMETPSHALLKMFISQKNHLAVVVDEYGGTQGVVTLEDVIEEMLGEEIVDEFDRHTDMQEFARTQAASKVK